MTSETWLKQMHCLLLALVITLGTLVAVLKDLADGGRVLPAVILLAWLIVIRSIIARVDYLRRYGE